MAEVKEDQLALAIGRAVIEAIKACQPEPEVVQVQQKYMTADQLVLNYDRCLSSIRILIREIRGQIENGRYPSNAILDGCGVYVSVAVFEDYLEHRKALKDPVAKRFVPKFAG